MNVMFLVNGRWFKTLCKTVLEADTFDVLISTEKHNVHAYISDKCYFLSIDNYSFENDKTLKIDFYFKRDFKNIKEFITKLDDVLSTFIGTSIGDKHFCGNIDECITKILDNIKETKRETVTKRKPITTDIDMIKDFTKETSHAKSLLNSVYGITAEREAETATETEPETTEEPETDEFNLTPEQTEKLISDYEDFIKQYESLKKEEEPRQPKQRQRQKRKPITTDIDMVKDFAEDKTQAKSLLNSVYGITAENDTTYKMNDVQFEAFKCQLKCLAPCDFPPDIVLTQITDEMTEKQLKNYCKILLDKGLAQYHRGVIATSKMGYTLYTLTHTYKILVFKDGKHVKKSIIHFSEKLV